ncbi:MerR family transcriptional regulator [Lactiplantibacillus sp. WILCCON 0030]|uniref:MerR family transcriptional regulator n=1 Tax=Lactiplantibacillus brownii TaxID=3069269 RepID=A0ABU1A7A9_9LACO|nr:MerR family transcriptional regulator [Lactiplantibacillus brownii]MDQ7936804.1 MerR family transcriptional regulator [Lactiplantibacillus brownii]
MTYTIKTVAEKTHLSIYTLRFYDKQGLLPFVSRNDSGYREFTDADLQLLRTITCLKNTGMKIATIRRYIDAVMAGPQTIPERRQLLSDHRAAILAEQQKIRDNLQEIDFKLNIYSASNAKQVITAERQFAKAEKLANHLPDPYPTLN